MNNLRVNMAKDAIKKKQRIAHNKTNEGHALFSEDGADILSSIIQDMDKNNLLAISSNNFDTYISDKRKTTSQEKPQTAVNQIPIQNHMTVPKSKKFGLARKGPLMEKSQRTLKLIQHNRKQPKPRAHLAGLSLPFENSASDEMSKAKNINNLRSTSKFENKVNANEVCNNTTTTRSKKTNSVEASKSNKISSKKHEIPEVKKYTSKESSHVVENIRKDSKSALIKTNSEQINNSSDSDEYEKFIRKEKKDLPKSIKNSTCNNTKSRKSVKARRKQRNSKSVSESESDEEKCKSYMKRKKRKSNEMLGKQSAASKKEKVDKKGISKCDSDTDHNETFASYKKKTVLKKLNRSSNTSNTESESEMNVDDMTNHNSSSDSDELPSPSEIMCGLQTTNNKNFERIGNDDDKFKLSSNSCKDFSNVSVAGNNKSSTIMSKYTSSLKTSDVTPVNSKQSNIVQNDLCSLPLVRDIKPNISFKSGSYSIGSAQPNVLQNTSNFPSNIPCTDKGKVSLQNSVFSHPENSKVPLIVDLVESDNECENSCTPLPKILEISSLNQSQSHSEESDVELVNVIVPPDLQKEVELLQNNNTSNSINTSLLNIKTEKVTPTISSNAQALSTNPNSKPQTLYTKKYEIAYTTGICQKYEKSISPNNVTEQHNSNNELHSAAKDSFILNKVKEEPSDELEVILDTVATDKPSLNISAQKAVCNRSIKVEQNSEIKQTSKHQTLNLLSKQTENNRGIQKVPDVKQSNNVINPIGALRSSDSRNTKDLVVSNIKVKKEPCDDCEIILDKSAANIQTPINKRIKTERDSKAVEQIGTAIHSASGPSVNLKEQEQKIHEIQSSTPKSLSVSQNDIAQTVEKELHTLNIEALLENLKKEFITYQEILETEESVETTFKMLQKIQADKLKSLKTEIMQSLALVSNADSDSCNSIKKAVDKLLAVPGLSSSTSLKDDQKLRPLSPNQSSSTSNISVQDLKTLANLVPLSTISEEDIKPNMSELQCAIKKEPSSSYESMSFGEKCIVCGKDASSACQRCAKVFFCSNQCGKKYWEEGHINNCVG